MNQVLFNSNYASKPFNYMIRRSATHSPEGSISVSYDNEGSQYDITTIMHHESRVNMSFAINAATRVSFVGDRYVHGWVYPTFSVDSSKNVNDNSHKSIGLSITAAARQFSSYIILIGRILSNNEFQPEHGILLKDNDRVKIPLYLEMIANQKTFKRALKTLSKTQQAFASAYRQMQLQHTLFGIVTIQIKPQLEKILHLSEDALMKEISLTQDIYDLLIQYEIPSDLLSVDVLESDSLNKSEGVSIVRSQVQSMKVSIVT
jgi:hypothetical protein